MNDYNTLDNGVAKICIKCEREFPSNSDFFIKSKNYKDGLESRCKECRGRNFTNKVNVKAGYKICGRCKRELPADTDHFHKSDKYVYGVSSVCKECNGSSFTNLLNIVIKDGYKYCNGCNEQYPMNDEYFFSDRYASDGFYSMCKTCKLKRSARWFYVNRKYRKSYDKERYKLNKEYHRKQHIKWAAANKDKLSVNQQRRYSKKKKLPATLTAEQWGVIKRTFNNGCAYCGVSEADNIKKFGRSLEQDHFIPLSIGGEYTHDNIVPACRSCNSSKRNFDFFVWYKEQDYYSEERERKILNHLNYSKGKQQLTLLFKDIV